jgi:replicative DNA helicase
VLGGIMLEPKLAFSVASDYLSRESFYLDGHGIIFELMAELHHRGIPPDSIAVLDELRARGLLEKVGGSGVVMGMLNAVPTAANVEYHARKLSEKAQLRNLIRGCTMIIDEAYKQEMNLDNLLDLAESTVLQLSSHTYASEFTHISTVLQGYWEKLDERHRELERRRAAGEENPRITMGLQTGFADLDAITGGLRPSELTIVAARPSMGKTALALNFCHNMAVINGSPIGIFSLEMGMEQLAERLLCMGTKRIDPRTQRVHGISSGRLANPDLTDEEWSVLTKAYNNLMVAPIYIDDSSVLTATMLKSKARRLSAHHKCECIIVDYLQLMSGGGNSDNRVQEVSEISRGLKQIARELHIPVVALSQLSRQVENRTNKRPHLSDLRESGAIEQDADVVMFIHREDYYTEQKYERGTGDYDEVTLPEAEIIVSKNRNGPTDIVRLYWFKEITRFLDRSGR